jgi:hypothetical protein
MATLYRGIAYPLRKDSVALPAPATDDDLIKQDLIQLIMTGRGERVMRPDLGTKAFSYVFENNDDLLAEMIRTDLRAVIGKYEPRIIPRNIFVDKDEENAVVVTIEYVVIATRKSASVEVRY